MPEKRKKQSCLPIVAEGDSGGSGLLIGSPKVRGVLEKKWCYMGRLEGERLGRREGESITQVIVIGTGGGGRED